MGQGYGLPPAGQNTLIMVSEPETLGPGSPRGSAQLSSPWAAATMHWPTAVFIDLGPAGPGPRPAAYSRIQPWLLLKTQAQRLPVAPASFVLGRHSQVTAQNANRAGAKEPLQPETKAVTSHTHSPNCSTHEQTVTPWDAQPLPTQQSWLTVRGSHCLSSQSRQAPSLRSATWRTLCQTSCLARPHPDATALLYFHRLPPLLYRPQRLPLLLTQIPL